MPGGADGAFREDLQFPRCRCCASSPRAGQIERIAHDLVVALDTVNNHVTYVLGKLGAANWTEAAARARQLGLIP